MDPIIEFLSRFDDQLPDWLVDKKRWVGVLSLALVLGLIAFCFLSLVGYVFPNSQLTEWLE